MLKNVQELIFSSGFWTSRNIESGGQSRLLGAVFRDVLLAEKKPAKYIEMVTKYEFNINISCTGYNYTRV